MALKLKGSTSGFVAIDAPSVAGNNTLILPENTGSAHQILANDITAGVTTFTKVTISRNGDLTVPGTISIGGTLTYEDVTSVDSVGIVTARSGVRINGGGLTIIGDTTGLKATGISTLGGDVSITGVTTISYTGTSQYGLDVYNPTSGSSGARVRAGDNDGQYAFLVENGAGTNLFEVLAGGGGARLRSGDLFILDKISHYGETDTHIRFPANDTITAETGGSERLRITSDGKVSIGNLASPDGNLHVYNSSAGSVTAAADANELVLESATNVGMSFLTANDQLSRIKFGDPDATNAGIIIYSHADDSFRFQHTTNERVRITSAGVVVVGHTAATTSGATNNASFNIVGNIGSATGEGQLNLWKRTAPSADNVLGQINFCGDTTGDPGAVIKGECDVAWDQGGDTSDHAGRLTFFTTPDNSSVAAERMRITNAGLVGINRTDPDQRLNVNGNIEVNAYDSTNASGGYYTAKGLIIGNLYDAGKSYTGSDDRTAIVWQERGLDLDFATSDALRLKIHYGGEVSVTGGVLGLGLPSNNLGMVIKNIGPGFLGPGSNVTIAVGTAYAGGRAMAHAYKTSDVTKQTTYYADFQARGTSNGYRANERTVTQGGGVNYSVSDAAKGFKITNNESFTITYSMMIEIVGNVPY